MLGRDEIKVLEQPEVSPEIVENDDRELSWGLRQHLLEVIKAGPEFPVFAQNVQELIDIPTDSYFPVQEVAGIILRDISLTTQILKIVNTVQFSSYARQIHTITTAVMVMGMERIRDLAVSLKIIETLQYSKGLEAFKRLSIQSLLTAVLCQELVRPNRSLRGEEVFISALLFNIGELVASFYLPDQYQESLTLADQETIPLSRAASKVLKVSFPELGLVALSSWGFPADLLERLNSLHQSQVYGSTAELKRLIQISQELTQNLSEANLSQKEWMKKGKRLCRELALEDERLQPLLSAGLDRFRELVKATRIDLSRLNLHLPPTPEAEGEPDDPGPRTAPAEVSNTASPREAPEDALDGGGQAELDRLKVCYQILGDINQALVLRLPINEIMSMVLEGLYRGVGFDRVVLCLVNPTRTAIQGRFGLGRDVEELLPVLQTSLSAAGNALARAVLDYEDYRLNRDSDLPAGGLMPGDFWVNSRAAALAITPLRIDKVPFGVFYMDRLSSQAGITEEEMQAIRIFRDQTIIAIRTTNAKL